MILTQFNSEVFLYPEIIMTIFLQTSRSVFVFKNQYFFFFFGDLQLSHCIVDAHLNMLTTKTACLERYVLQLCRHVVGLLYRYHWGLSYRGFALRHNKFIFFR